MLLAPLDEQRSLDLPLSRGRHSRDRVMGGPPAEYHQRPRRDTPGRARGTPPRVQALLRRRARSPPASRLIFIARRARDPRVHGRREIRHRRLPRLHPPRRGSHRFPHRRWRQACHRAARLTDPGHRPCGSRWRRKNRSRRTGQGRPDRPHPPRREPARRRARRDWRVHDQPGIPHR